MAETTTNLKIPLLSGNNLVNKTVINNALKAVDGNALPLSHAKGGGHWPVWKAGTEYALNDIIRTDDCYSWGYLQCTTAGTSGSTAIKCPYGEGDTVTDGTVVWMLKKLGGSVKHGDLTGRNLPDQHTIEAITGLRDALDGKASKEELATAKQEAIATSNTYTDTKILNLIDGAPEALNTLNELASGLKNEESAISTIVTQLANKVDKIAGKGLSTNDYDAIDNAKVDKISVTKPINLDNVTDSMHTHINKTLLDTYTQTDANLSDAVSKKHSHANKDVIDKLTATATGVAYNGTELSTLTQKDLVKYSLIF